MSGIRWLCEHFPAYQRQFVWLGYILLLLGVAFWFLCFPLLAFSLYFFDKFPADFIHSAPNRPPLPKHALMVFSAIITAVGIPIIYFSLSTLGQLRRNLPKA